jgi:hypothetical protein
MPHDLPEWFDLDGWLAGLQEIPVVLQFRPMDFGPCLDEPPFEAAKSDDAPTHK